MSPIEYLLQMPATVPDGKILVHNRGQPTSRLGSRAFKAWFDDPSDRYTRCVCGWASNLSEHYQLSQRGSGIPPSRTKKEIETILAEYGAHHFTYLPEPAGTAVMFEAHGQRLRFCVPLDEGAGAKAVRACNQRWRDFLQCIKAKLESVTSGIESFPEAFLAHVVMSDNRTVYEFMAPLIAQNVNDIDTQPLQPETKENMLNDKSR